MKLMDKEKFIISLKEVLDSISGDTSDYSIMYKLDNSREEKSGSLSFTFTIKNKKDRKAKEYKVALYIFENRKTVTSFIINGRTLNLLFENSTMDSPTIALHYLKDILLSEVKWARNIDGESRKLREGASKKKFDERRKPRQPRSDGSRKNYEHKNYHNNGSRTSHNNFNKKSSFNNSYGSINIRTNKRPYENSKSGGSK